jgi:hypothetical protein
LFVHLDVRIPKKLTCDQRKLFEQLATLLPVFEKVRGFFG